MSQTSAAAPVHARPTNDSPESTLLDPLLRLAGNLRNPHALIGADHCPDLVCGLTPHGAQAGHRRLWPRLRPVRDRPPIPRRPDPPRPPLTDPKGSPGRGLA